MKTQSQVARMTIETAMSPAVSHFLEPDENYIVVDGLRYPMKFKDEVQIDISSLVRWCHNIYKSSPGLTNHYAFIITDGSNGRIKLKFACMYISGARNY